MGLFKKKNKRTVIDRELDVYRRESLLVIDRELADYRKKIDEEIRGLAIKCANDTKKYEHTYHSNMESLRVEIAKLEAKKENLKEIVNTDKIAYEKIIKAKDEEISRLNKIVSLFVESQYEDA
jgi:hypothetical protein